MYDEEFFAKANLQSFVNFLIDDEMINNETDEDSPLERYNKYMRGISEGLKSFHETEISDFQLRDYDHGPAASQIWENIWKLETLHFEMGFRTGATFFADVSSFQLGPLLDSRHKKGGNPKMHDEQRHNGNPNYLIDLFYSNFPASMRNTINLQNIGHIIRGNTLRKVDTRNFSEREKHATSKLHKDIASLCGEDIAEKIREMVNEYDCIMNTMYFSLGMKAGATLQVKLLDNFETDI